MEFNYIVNFYILNQQHPFLPHPSPPENFPKNDCDFHSATYIAQREEHTQQTRHENMEQKRALLLKISNIIIFSLSTKIKQFQRDDDDEDESEVIFTRHFKIIFIIILIFYRPSSHYAIDG